MHLRVSGGDRLRRARELRARAQGLGADRHARRRRSRSTRASRAGSRAASSTPTSTPRAASPASSRSPTRCRSASRTSARRSTGVVSSKGIALCGSLKVGDKNVGGVGAGYAWGGVAEVHGRHVRRRRLARGAPERQRRLAGRQAAHAAGLRSAACWSPCAASSKRAGGRRCAGRAAPSCAPPPTATRRSGPGPRSRSPTAASRRPT